jgi:hypothetical protein
VPSGTLTDTADILFAAAPPNPSPVAIEATNIPPGTVVQVTATPGAGGVASTVASTPLAGTTAASTASANVTLGAGMTVLTATATVEVGGQFAKRIVAEGEPVARIEITARYGRPSELYYITRSGKRVRVA